MMGRIGFIATVLMALSGCSHGVSCSKLEEIARTDAVRSYLKEWVDERVRGGDYVLSENGEFGKLRLPGEYAVNIFLDRSILGMNEPEARAIIGKDRQVESFFFGEENFRGILIKTLTSSGYGFPRNRLKEIDERTAIVCIEH